jgi:hypothetical protein
LRNIYRVQWNVRWLERTSATDSYTYPIINFVAIRPEFHKGCIPMRADFGLSQRGDGPEPLMHPIQPVYCHAPKCCWTLRGRPVRTYGTFV